ncbi:hypothetical protein BC835DRAFT_1271922 [Cytidiella melzeri]|nr:hypothetical protein BC835DRAFT_1271922 [Cytidiella melzeri]
MSDQTYQVSVDGTLSWDLIFNYDNSTNSGAIRESIMITTVESVEFTAFEQTFNETVRKELEKEHVNTEVGASYEGINSKIDASIDVSSEVNDTLRQTTENTFKSNYSKTTTFQRDITVGPNSKLALYQQRFQAPGINVQGSAVSTNPPSPQAVTIEYTVKPIRFVKDIEVHYGDHPSDAPANRVLELSGGNDDINYQYGGKYVWIVPTFTYNAALAATRFDLFIQKDAHSGWSDLAKGAGGDYRYLEAVPDTNNSSKLTDLKLYRSNNAVGAFPLPYTGHTSDINSNRGKTYLYLIWSSVHAF